MEKEKELECFWCDSKIRKFKNEKRHYNFFLLFIEDGNQDYECHIGRSYFDEYHRNKDSEHDVFFCFKCAPKFDKIDSIDIPKHLPKGQFKKWLIQLLKSKEVKQ